ncbi:hypothetical protein LGQ25_002887 [Listeria monocytogenes]|uniref:helix-turn-helix domain-containing protein n=1 Tax=Listeria monocytogenes TaxID=1639 RepID=UPI0010D81CAF|nr:helix-turn-helix domain-containing protein [Listeria monocytogenes]EAE1303751.1 hypothetical protein [Listeria monocytogenes]EIA3595552.1 hypothetical protein [Listeria monocytogenes]EII0397079.1 hypothetical protein [Listeria monocytogenes]EIO8245513.1 hypothetical protein [Listeria monocytogenes]EIS4452260.1 hypothetical protein [Listeria monocytogenes]
MNILDEFLNEHQITRYRLSKITGISNQLLLQYTKKTLEEYPVWLLRALAAATDQTIEEVLNKLEILETEKHQLYGIRSFLEKYNCSFPQEEWMLYRALYLVEALNMDLEEMKFDRFEKEEHVNIEKDVQEAVSNAVSTIDMIRRKKLKGHFKK